MQTIDLSEFEAPKTLLFLLASKYLGNLLIGLDLVKAASVQLAQQGHTPVGLFDASYQPLVEAAGLPKVMRCIYYPRRSMKQGKFWSRISIMTNFLRELRQIKADIVLDIDGDNVHGNFARLSGAQLRVGNRFSHKKNRFNKIIQNQDEAETRWENYWRVIEWLPIQKPNQSYARLQFSTAIKQQIDHVFERYGIDNTQPIVAIHPSANKAYKQWPVANFTQLTQSLSQQGCQVVLVGAGKLDKEKVDVILENAHAPVIDLCNRLSLPQLYTLYTRCALIIGNDTGPSHLAASTGRPCIAIFGPTNEKFWGPMGKNVTILKGPTPCESHCLRSRCVSTSPYHCLSSLTANAVILQSETVLNSKLVR
ncbi:MAG: glycosyltransferase family 9 protein [Pseudomonadota bacterium]